MKVSGTAVLHGEVDAVYAALNDPAVLVRTIPGCQRLEQVSPDSYQATVTAGVASIKGEFSGDVYLSDQRPPHSLVLRAAGVGAPGTVTADVTVTLADNGDGTTRLSYDADAVVGGMIGGVGQRILTSVARKTAGEFFAAVDAILSGQQAPEMAALPERTPAAAGQPQVPASPPAATRPWTAAVYTRPPAPPAAAGARTGRELLLGLVVGATITLLGGLVGGLRPGTDFALGMAAGAGVALVGALVGGLVAGRAARRR
jgi:carbon monoxide dehydrogenase subunit G